MTTTVSVKKLFDYGAHLGHQTKRWNPKIIPFLYGSREGVHIFDLEKTREALEAALEEIKNQVASSKTVLIVGTKRQVSDIVEATGHKTNMPYVNKRWLGGTLTNFEQIQKSLKKLADMKVGVDKGEYKNLTKWERLQVDRKIEKMEEVFGGITSLTQLPDLMIVVDTKREQAALLEAKRAGVPVIGIIDTNSDPGQVDWPIPMNDDSTKALEYVFELITQSLTPQKAKKAVKSLKKASKTKK